MKKYLFLILGILISSAQQVYCAVQTASPELENSLKDNSHEPGIMSIIFALAFVILLIYITGIIYSKLNIVGAKTVQKQLKNYDLNKAVVLSTTQLGRDRNIHVIELGSKRFLIGSAPNSINMLKELEEIKEEEVKAEEDSPENKEETEEESFDIHKKYL